MRNFTYRKIDAFASEKSVGNPAACILLKDNDVLTEDEMLFIAKQHQHFVSEMVYCSKSKLADLKLTYFSSECEVDFCGHGTIACMYDIIKNNPDFYNKDEIAVETNKKGILTVYNELKQDDAVYITAPDPIHIGNNLSKQKIADELGLTIDNISDKYPIDVINGGLTTLIVPVSNLKDEISLFPNEKSLKEFCNRNQLDIILIYSLEVSNPVNIAHTRIFAPKFGYLEDPATGSGNSAFGYYMLKNNLWNGNTVSIEQGGCDRIFNIVKLTTRNQKVLFGGRATKRIDGEYYL